MQCWYYKTVYLGNTDTQNGANVDAVTHDIDSDDDHDVGTHGIDDDDHDVGTHGIDSDNNHITFSTMNVHDQIEAELDSRKKNTNIDPYEFLSADFKELLSLQNGRGEEGLRSTQQVIRAEIYKVKQEWAKNNNNVTGDVVTCTMGNTKERCKRFRHKKQKFY